ncbi:MAG: beta-ketoacyl-[acyl-carrier-protein] synthase family protein [Sulfurospirillum sp.]
MKCYINNYALLCDAGDTKNLMDAVYDKESAITVDDSYVKDATAGLGIMQYDDIYTLLKEVVGTVLKESNLENFHSTLLILGSSVGGMQECEAIFYSQKSYKNIDPNRYSMNALTDFLDKEFGFCGSRAISTACTSSANALLLAKRLINVDAYENVLVVGADGLCKSTVLGFYALSVLSGSQCRPFDANRDGMNVAEAVAALLLQNSKNKNSIELKGAGASSDAYHMTNPDPEATGAVSSMRDALNDAGLKPKDIDYVNAHGTATVANDRVEAKAIEILFGKKGVPVSSTKAITGHTLGAAGAVEAIISCESIKRSLIPPQANLSKLENPNIDVPMISAKKNIRNIISNSFAFGGNNASLVFGATQ